MKKNYYSSLKIFWKFLSISVAFLVFSYHPGIAYASSDCGGKVWSLAFYQKASLYSLIAGFSFSILGILVDRKAFKTSFWLLATPMLFIWGYVNYIVDFDQIQKTVFTYNVQAESALANIAEGQERYKSEHGAYLTDLNKLYSHLAGAHGVDKCVKILDLRATSDSWSATAQHVSSPDQIRWDGKTGSSMKKG